MANAAVFRQSVDGRIERRRDMEGEQRMRHQGRAIRLLLRGLLIVGVLAAFGASTAAAAPDNKNTFVFHVTCPDAGGALTLTEIDANGNARWVQGSTSVFVVTSVVGEITSEGATFPVN
ncbi:MAG TPA: hypothetical protein VFV93_18905, partial [Thermomicrobiales bacterium]|nr:hypothetical protein [Thermomicrobiales bacterium]